MASGVPVRFRSERMVLFLLRLDAGVENLERLVSGVFCKGGAAVETDLRGVFLGAAESGVNPDGRIPCFLEGVTL